jgi:pyridoxal biosynthesis lyase PdxS
LAEFIFMLTHQDCTVPNALDVLQEARGLPLRYVGFKDIGLPFERLQALSSAIHAAGQKVMLEVVSIRKEDELRSVKASVELGVDYLLGGTHVEEASAILADTGIRYYPFPGRVIGHPSVLRGTIEEITESARYLTQYPRVSGLDLLAYRYDGAVEELVGSVIKAVDVPVIAAGSVDTAAKIRRLMQLGVWGFTVGSAIFEKEFAEGGSIRTQLEAVLSVTDAVSL